MKLHEELYFEITVEGAKKNIVNFITFITSGELDDFFEFSSDFIIYSDDFPTAKDGEEVIITLANDDFGIEIDEFDPEKFLDILCSGGSSLVIHGHLYDIDDEEYRFISDQGAPCYINVENIKYSDALDEEAQKEDRDSEYYDEY